MARFKKKAQTWHLKGALGLGAVFAGCLVVSGALGGVSPLGLTSTRSTGTRASAVSSSHAGMSSHDKTATASAHGTAASSRTSASHAQFIVTFAQGTSSSDQASEIAAAGATDVSAIAPLSMHTINVPAGSKQAVISALRADSNVADVERNDSRKTEGTPSDPGYVDQWNLPMVGWDQIYGSANPLGSSTIAVLDTGVSGSTGDLNLGAGWSAFGTDPTNDPNGHGTAVASIAAATTGNGGIAGVDFSPVTILPVQVLDSNGLGQDSDIVQGIVWAADNGANVILMSFSNPGFSQALQDAISYAWGKGAVVVAATGNGGASTPTYPAGDADVMGVAGTDQSDQPWASSNTGADTFLAAPATSIPADATDGSETSITGTSASAAMVAGAAALLLANDPLATNAIVDGRLGRNADPVGTADQTGNGRLNLARAFTDTSTDPITPLGAPGGGPLVGPYVIANKTLTITFAGTGGGSVAVTDTTTPADTTTCTGSPNPCSVPTANNDVGTLAATPNATSTFAGWSAQTSGVTGCSGNTCNFSMGNTGQSVTATFNITTPTLTGTSPSSPGNTTTPKIIGTAPTGSTVKLYTNNTCTSAVAGSGTAAAFASPGLSVTVTANTSTTFWATATIGSNTSPCSSSSVTYVEDSVAPTASLSCLPSASPSNSTSFNCSVTFSESVSGFDSTTSDVTIGGTSSTWTKGASSGSGVGPYTFTVSRGAPNSDGTLTIQVSAGAAQDAATNTSTASNTVSYTIDTTKPTATLSCLPSASPSNSTSFNCSVTFSESVSGFDSTTSDVTIGGTSSAWTKSASSGSGAGPYTFTVSRGAPNTDGTLTIQVAAGAAQDAATNTNTASNTVSYTIDTTAPTAALSCLPSASPSNSTSFNCSVTFSESVSGFDSTTSDVTIGGTSSNWTKGASSGSGAGPYTFTVSRGSPNTDGSLTIQVAAGAAQDAATNTSTASNTVSYTIDTTKPTATLSCLPSANPSNSTSFNCTANFSESVTGFSSAGVTTGGTSLNWTVGTVSGSGSGPYTFTVSRTAPNSDGTLTIQVAAGAAQDAASNGNTASNTVSYTIDTTAPTAALSCLPSASPSNSTSFNCSVTFSESVSGFDSTTSDVTIGGTSSNWTKGASSGSGAGPYTFTVSRGSPNTDGSLTIQVAAGAAQDAATNSSTASNTVSYTIDTIAPTGTLNINSGATYTNTTSVTLNLNATDTGGTGIVSYRVAQASDCSSASFVTPFTAVTPYSANVAFTLTTGDGSKTVCVQYKDAAGNISSNATHSITLDTIAPTSSITFPANNGIYTNGQWTTAAGDKITGTASDATSGTASVAVTIQSTSGATNGMYWNGTSFSSSTPLTFAAANTGLFFSTWSLNFPASNFPADGTFTVTSTATDNAGNVQGTAASNSFTIANGTISGTVFNDLNGNGSFDSGEPGLSGVIVFICSGTQTSCNAGSGSLIATNPTNGSGNYSFTGLPVNATYTVDYAPPSGGFVNTGTKPQVDSLTLASKTATNNFFAQRQADLSITKTDGTASAVPGTSTTYTIVASNAGPAAVTSATVFDNFPAAVTSDSWTATQSGGASNFSASGSGTINDSVNLPVGASITYTVIANIASSATGSLSNTATISPPGGIGDPSQGNNSATDTDTLTPQADLQVTKTAAPDPATAGTDEVFTVKVHNAGPSDSAGYTLTDGDPSGTSFVSAPGCTNGSGATTCASTGLAAGATDTYTITYHISPSFSDGGTLTNTASLTAESTSDPDHTNNSATSTTTVNASADLQVTKTAAPDPATAGTDEVFTVKVHNAGPSDSAGYTLTDGDPSGTSFVSAPGCTNGSGATTCASTGLAAGATDTYTITYHISPSFSDGGTLTNTASLTAESTSDPDHTNNSATSTTTVNRSADVADLKAAASTVIAGDQLTYTITVTNNGPSDATAVSLSDPLDSHLNNPVYCVDTSGTCIPLTPWPLTNMISLGDMAAGTTQIVTIQATVDPSTPQGYDLSNTATVSSTTPDPNPNNNDASTDTTVQTEADLQVTKTAAPDPATAGTDEVFTVKVHNAGPSDSAGYTLTDGDPSGTSFVSAPGCTNGSGATTCASTGLAAGATDTYTITYHISPSFSDGGTLTNTASLTAESTSDPDHTNNSATSTTTVNASADLQVTKTAAPDPATAGTDEVFTVKVHNAGPSDSAGYTLTDGDPSGTSFVSAPGCTNGSGATTCASTGLAAGATDTYTITYHISPSFSDGGTLTNTASLTAESTSDPDHTNNSATSTTTVNASADLQVTKTAAPDPATAGTDEVFTVKVHNAGPSDSAGYTLTDGDPSGTSFVSAPGCTNGSGATTCASTGLAAGATDTYTITYHISPSFSDGGTLTNTASLTAESTSDPDHTNNSATSTTTVNASADLQVTKTAAPDPATAGTDEVFTVKVHNAGPSDSAGYTLTDGDPSGTSFVSAPGCTNGSGATTCASTGLAAGATDTYTITYHISPSFSDGGTLTNTASLTAESTSDPDHTNNSATSTTTVNASADLQVTKTAAPDPATAGTDEVFTVKVHNAGPSDSAGYTLTDGDPSGTSFVSAPGCTNGSGATTCASTGLAAGATDTYTITYHISPSFSDGGTLTNTASLTAESTSDPDHTNNSATSTTTVNRSADVADLKAAASTVIAGDQLTYTITVTNNGPSDATAVSLSDPLDSHLNNPVYCVDTSGTCIPLTPWPLTNMISLGDMAAGTTQIVTIQATVDPSTPQGYDLSNTATVSSTTPDPNPNNNDASTDTTVQTEADLQVTKTAAPDPATAGTDEVFTVKVHNAGPSDSAGYTLTDGDPSGTSFVSAPGCTNGSGATTCASTGLAAGATDTYTITYHISPSFSDGGTLTNTASLTAESTSDPDHTNNSATSTTTVNASADLQVTKTAAPDPATAGTDEVFTVKVHNAGPSDSAGYTLTDGDPSGTSFVSAPGCTNGSGATTCASTGLAAGATDTYTITYHISPSFSDGGTLTNTASLTAESTSDPDHTNNSATSTTTVNASADLQVTKTAAPDPATAGTDEVFTVKVHNAGPSDSAGYTLTDGDPSGTSFVSAPGCTNGSGATTCASTGLAAGATDTYTITYHISPSFSDGGTLTNTASLTAESTSDPDHTNNSATSTTTVNASADLQVTKTAAPDPATAGTDEVFTVKVHNAGPSDSAGYTLTDGDPSGTSFVSAPGCTNGSGATTCASTGLAAGATDTYTITYHISPSFSDGGTLTNTASLTAESTSDPDHTNNSATSTTTVNASADLQVTKTAAPDPATAGTDEVFTVKVHNAGPSDSAGYTLTDGDPSGTSFVSAPGCTNGSGATTCASTGLAAGATDTYTITYHISPSFSDGGTLTNTASLTAESTSDPDHTNNSATSTTTVNRSADVADLKAAASTVIAGDQLTYTITVTNNGPSDATAVSLSDPLDSHLNNPVYCVDTSGTCIPLTPWPLTNMISLGDMAAGTTQIVTIQATVDPSTPQGYDLSNTATVSSTTPDPNPNNNDASTDTTVQTEADLQVTKTAAPDPATAGTDEVFTVKVHNAGPSDSAGYTLTDGDPSGTSFVSAPGCTNGSGATTCASTGLAAGATDTYTITYHISPSFSDGGTLTNTASLTAESTSDPDHTNNSATSTTTVNASADLQVTKTAAPDPATAGTDEVFTVKVHNAGPSDSAGYTLTDGDPSGTSFVSAPGCTNGSGATTCASTGLAAGATDTYTITYHISPSFSDGGTLTNTASLTAESTSDPDHTNNSATSTTTVNASADLQVTKTAAPDPATAGTDEVFTVKVHNAGPSDSAGYTLTDGDPSGTSFVSAPGCTNGSGATTCASTGLAAGATDTYTITYHISPSFSDGGTLTNTASLTAESTSDPDHTNNSATSTTTVNASADLQVTKTAAPDPATAGTDEVFTVKVHNAGPSDSAGYTLTDGDPSGTSFVSAPGCTNGSGATTCASTGLAAGATDTYTITYHISPSFSDGGTLTNTASLTAESTSDPDHTNNSATSTTTVNASADLQVTKTAAPDPATAGTDEVFTVKVHNAGPSDSAGYTLTDGDPSGTSFVSAPGCTNGSGATTCASTGLAAGATDTYTITYHISPSFSDGGTLTNTASLTAESTSDPDHTNNSATSTTTVNASADLQVTKTAAPDPATAGTDEVFTVKVHNAGPSDSAGYTLTDGDPSGTSFVSAPGCTNGSGATTCASTGLAAGATDTYTITYHISPSFSDGGTLTNTASLTAESTSDPDHTNNSATSTTTVNASADLQVTKTAAPDPATAGTDEVFTVKVHNAGPSDSAGYTLTDGDPSGTSFVSAPGCTNGSGATTCASTGLAAGATDTYTITYHISPSFSDGGTLTNTASLTAESTSDPDHTNNSATSTTTVNASADLQVTKTAAPDPATAGTDEVFTVKVHNAGPSDSAGYTLTDGDPSGTSFVSAPGCTNGSGATTCASTGLAAGATDTYTITYHISPSFSDGGTLTNTASLTAESTSDPDHTNNSATSTTTVNRSADVADLKAAASTVIAGDQLTYTITVTNNGPSDATAVSLSDPLDSHLNNPVYCVDTSGTCIPLTPWPLTNMISLGDMAAGTTQIVTIQATVDPSTPQGYDLSNTATVSSTTPDPNPNNNDASTDTTVQTNADISVTKSDGVTSVVADGSTVHTYTIVVSNAGPSDAQSVSLSDTWPTGFTRGTVTAPGGDSCDTTTSTTNFTCNLHTIAAGGSKTVTATYTVPASTTASQTNTATVSSPTDTTPANNTASDTDTVNTNADISVTKDDGVTSVTAGAATVHTYTIVVSNAGPSDAQSVSLSDTWPTGFTRGTVTAPGGDSCDTTTSTTNFTCNLHTIAAGGSKTVTATYTVPASTTASQTNTATVSSPTDTTPANNTASDTDTINTSADLSITKSDNPDPVTAGNNLVYTITVTNGGPSTARNVQISDPVPAGTTYVSSDNGGSNSAGTVTWNIGDLAPGSTTVHMTVNVNPSTTGTLSNTATVSSTTTDPTPGDHSATETTTVNTNADISVTKSDGVTSVVADGSTVHTYTIVVSNAGPSDAQSVSLSDTWPTGFTRGTVTAPGGDSCDTTTSTTNFTCNLHTIAAGGSKTVTATYTVPASTTASQTNTATVSSPTDTTPANNTASDTDTVTPTLQANDDNATVNGNSTNNVIDVLANDNPNNGSVPIWSVNNTSATPSSATTTITTAQGGTATICNASNPCIPNTPSGQGIYYTPATDYIGPDSFWYTIKDGSGNKSTAKVSINVVATGSLDSQMILEDSNMNNQDGEFNVLFGKSPKPNDSTAVRLQNTEPGNLHLHAKIFNHTNVNTGDCTGPPGPNNGCTINNANGNRVVAVLTIPDMPANCGGSNMRPYTNLSVNNTQDPNCSNPGGEGMPAFALQGGPDGKDAVHAHPDDKTDNMKILVQYLTYAQYVANGNSCADNGSTPWSTTLPSGGVVKCVKVSGLAIPVNHSADIDVNVQFQPIGTDWPASANPAQFFHAGFNFKLNKAVTFDYGTPSAKTYTATDNIDTVGVGKKVTAVGGFIFKGAADPQAGMMATGYSVRLFNSPTDAGAGGPAAPFGNCSAFPVAFATVDSGGFYFIQSTGFNDPNANNPPQNLPANVQYFVQVCNGSTAVDGALIDHKLGNNEFEEWDMNANPAVPRPMALTIKHQNGKPDNTDTVEVDWTEPLAEVTMCSTWGWDNTKDQTLNGVTLRIENGTGPGGDDQLVAVNSASFCGGTFHFGKVDLGSPNYVTANADFTSSKIQWNHNGTLLFTLGGGPNTTLAVTSALTAIYTPDSAMMDTSGNSATGTASDPSTGGNQSNF